MLRVNLQVQFNLPGFGDQERRLYPGRVTSFDEEDILVMLTGAEAVAFQEIEDLTIFFQPQRQFVKQRAKLLAFESFEIEADEAILGQTARRLGMSPVSDVPPDPQPTFQTRIRPLGAVESAESRGAYRASSAGGRRMVRFDGAPHRLLDASATGAAVESLLDFSLGDTVAMAFDLEGKAYDGLMLVQSVRAMDRGMSRYGLQSISDRHQSDTLPRGLQAMSMMIQREQAQRHSRLL